MWNRRDHGASEMNYHKTIPKAGLHSKEGYVHIVELEGNYELLPENQTINSNNAPNALQLDQLNAALDKRCLELVNRKRIIFHQDTARPYVSLMTRQKLLQLGWEVLIHLPYSPDIAPLDFHLFRTLQNSLSRKNSNSWKTVKGIWNSSLLKMIESLGKVEL